MRPGFAIIESHRGCRIFALPNGKTIPTPTTHGLMTIFPLMLIRSAGLPLQWLDDLTADWPEVLAEEETLAIQVQQRFDETLAALSDSDLRTVVYNARRDFFQKRKLPNATSEQLLNKHRDEPLIAQLVEGLDFWKQNQTRQKAFQEKYEAALSANFRVLQQAACDETLRRALLFASHDLLDRLPVFAQKPLERFNKKDRQTALSLLQYLTRATAKTSPLSRFGTVSVHSLLVGSSVESDADFLFSPKPVVTPNVALLPALYQVLLREPAFCKALSLSLNPSVTDVERRTWLYFDGEQEAFQHLKPDAVADFVVKSLLENERRLAFPDLLARLGNEVEATSAQLQDFVFELVDVGLLEWDLPEKGLSPGWCGALYNFLGFLPQQPSVVTEAAALLQWLRTAARTLPFQILEDAQATQREAVRLANDFFEKNGGAALPIPPEQIFFEDATEPVEAKIAEKAVRALAEDLAECWRQRDVQALPPFRTRVFSFAEKLLGEGETLDFLDFSKKFLEEKTAAREQASSKLASEPTEKIGALLQIFQDETGVHRAVVNGLFPGGGKLFARWLHLFPAEMTEQLKIWGKMAGAPFPWQGWSNANFQPVILKNNLLVPDGRTANLRGGRQILLGNLALKRKGKNLQLVDKETNEPVSLIDLGLEASGTRPPVMQVLWHLGTPPVSLEMLLPPTSWVPGEQGWRFRKRVEFGSLVLARATWELSADLAAKWLEAGKGAAFFKLVGKALLDIGAPTKFFARSAQERPQYFDRDSPLSMLLFAKMLRQENAPFFLTEMLPLPEQCVVQKNGLRAAEFVVEFEV